MLYNWDFEMLLTAFDGQLDPHGFLSQAFVHETLDLAYQSLLGERGVQGRADFPNPDRSRILEHERVEDVQNCK